MYECNDKMVSHPDHYQSETGMEVIDVIEAFTFDLTGIEAVDTGNALKYLCRWKKKNGLQDLNKARWYLEHLIDHVEKLEEENKSIKEPIRCVWECKHCGDNFRVWDNDDWTLIDHMRSKHPNIILCCKDNDFKLIDFAVKNEKEND